jgi:hypothetical protein
MAQSLWSGREVRLSASGCRVLRAPPNLMAELCPKGSNLRGLDRRQGEEQNVEQGSGGAAPPRHHRSASRRKARAAITVAAQARRRVTVSGSGGAVMASLV